jgi:1-acyl-sn-glycerol-3-phosphate acyltransferase
LVVYLGFFSFGIAGLMLWLTVFQVVRLFSKNKYESQTRVRKIISFSFRVLLNLLDILGILKIEADSLEELHDLKGSIIISNHPCLLDVVAIMARLGNCQCIVKNKLWLHPLLGGVMRSAGFIQNNLDPEKLLQECKQQLACGQNIVIFPEGTRSNLNQPIKLQRGVGNLALFAMANIQALIINCSPLMWTKQNKWHEMPMQKITLRLSKGKVFLSEDYSGMIIRSLMVRKLMHDIQEYYNKKLGYE